MTGIEAVRRSKVEIWAGRPPACTARPRAIGVSLGFSTAVSIFGGLAPLVATWLIAATGDSLSPSYYLIFTALLSLFALMAIQRRSRRATQAFAHPAQLAAP